MTGPGEEASLIVSPPREMIETDLLCLLFPELDASVTSSGVLGSGADGKPLEVLSESAGLCVLVFGLGIPGIEVDTL